MDLCPPRLTLSIALLCLLPALAPACSGGEETRGSGGSTTSATSASSTSTPTTSAGDGGKGGAGGAGTGGESTGGHNTGGESTGGQGGGGAAPVFCGPSTVVTVADGASAFTVTTDHYELRAQAPKDDAEEMARLLEAAYGAMQAYFEAAPPLGAGERLVVKFFVDHTSWVAGLAADGIAAPAEAGGYYEPSNGIAYLYRQGNPYFNHVLLVHEAVHQFHFLSRVKNPSLPFWYVEGLAESLSRHDWDNHCVRLGVVPLLSWEDLPADALALSIDVPSVVSGSAAASRAIAWSMVHFLDHGDGGAHRAGFKSYRDAIDANVPNPSFATLVADPASLSQPLNAFVAASQEPMMPIYTEWMHVGQHATLSDSPTYFSLAVTKGDVSHFETRYDVPPASSWSVGVVMGYEDDQNYVTLQLGSDGGLQVWTAKNGSLTAASAGSAPTMTSGGVGSLSVDFGAGGTVSVTVNGATSAHQVALSPRSGLTVDDTRALFHDIDWH